MKVKTSSLSGMALNWAVTLIELERQEQVGEHVKGWLANDIRAGRCIYPYSTDWLWGGPIIDRMKFEFKFNKSDQLFRVLDNKRHCWRGETHLIAAMRAYLASVKGDEIEFPMAAKCFAS
ncbi:phage protein NinX family protein [Hydrogenophaga sp. NFH-34]|uniref:phage protein NinX family protein n=1 Tax=Hydrogenophaga sp. NFH-34 TaxID=2744446 RepID=UPI001F471C98|nr:phage protein NinX family protein [Hydrogenophaga sp. NFH-34]